MLPSVSLAKTGKPTADGGADLEAVFRRFAAGELAALAQLYDLCAAELHGLALWRCGSRAEAEDAVQEVFVRLATTTADLSRVRNPRAYLLTMARRAACDLLKRRRPGEPLGELLVAAVAADPAAAVDAGRASLHLRALPAAQREALYLRHFAGLTFAEIGAVTGVPKFTAASRCRNGLDRLRALLGVES
jgi:RNA polymerase sigma-70 factor, ECF subfamily